MGKGEGKQGQASGSRDKSRHEAPATGQLPECASRDAFAMRGRKTQQQQLPYAPAERVAPLWVHQHKAQQRLVVLGRQAARRHRLNVAHALRLQAWQAGSRSLSVRLSSSGTGGGQCKAAAHINSSTTAVTAAAGQAHLEHLLHEAPVNVLALQHTARGAGS